MTGWSARAHARFGIATAASLVLAGCGWPGLIAGAITTPTSADDAATNVAVADGVAYVARSARGIETIDLASGARRMTAAPPPADRIDDVVVADGLVFALDATPPGHLLVLRRLPQGRLQALSATAVAVGPFSGVAAGSGRVIISGGTSALGLYRYRMDGRLDPTAAHADFGRGQPDVALAAGGRVALVSTHVQGPRFGLTVADVLDAPLSLRARGYVALPGAGFTPGGFHPANFPLQAAGFGEFAVVAHGGGLSVVSTRAGEAPRLLGTTALGLHATALAVDAPHRIAYVTGAPPRAQLLTVSLADPRRPRVLAREPLMAQGSPSAVALDATHVVVALQGGGVYVGARHASASAAPTASPFPLETD